MALLETLTENFSGTLAQWTANGATIIGGQGAVACNQNAGAAVFSSLTSAVGYTWQGSYLLLQVPLMPAVAGVNAANAQFWVNDPAPANTVDRLGFEYVAAANRLDMLGQTGATYSSIGTATSVTYSATTHAWLRINHTGTAIVWQTSPDASTWTTQRTYNVIPTWTTKATLQAQFSAFRTNGTNDTLRIDNINLPPSAAPAGAGGAFMPFFR